MKFKKITSVLHLWLGLGSGFVIFVLGITGAIYVFTDELKTVFYRDRLFVEASSKPRMPLSKLIPKVEKELEGNPVSRVEMYAAPDRSYVFRSMKLDPEGFSHWDYYKFYKRVYVNPYDGTILYVENSKNEFFNLVLGLHMRLLFGEKIGHAVVSYSVLAFVVLLLSGIVLWMPKKWNTTERNKSFKIKWSAKFKRINYDLHNVLGFYAFLVLLMIAITGLCWSFDWMKNSVRYIANGAKNVEKVKPAVSDSTQFSTASAVDVAFSSARTQSGQAFSFLINFPSKPEGTINISSYLSSWNLHDRVQASYDRYTGKLLRSSTYEELNTGDKVYQLNYDLHTGTYLNLPSRILAFVASLIAACLPLTGFYIWWGKRPTQKKQRSERLIRMRLNR
jgi:uncharacterized iron-regulated membrane protein